MNIYQEDGALDIGQAVEELRATPLISNEKGQRSRVAEITAAALLDIAASLRPIGAEAAEAMASIAARDDDEPEPEHGDMLLVGDVVHVVGTERVGEISSFAYDADGDLLAYVGFESADLLEGEVTPFYVSSLERVIGDENPPVVSTDEEDAAMIDEGIAPELFADDATDGRAEQAIIAERDGAYYDPDVPVVETEVVEHDARELVEADIDADFDGDSHDEAQSAVEVLKANEAARKAAKKAKAKPAAKKGSKK